MDSACYKFKVKWGQTGNYVQSGCDNTLINCDEQKKIANLLPSVANMLLSTYMHIPLKMIFTLSTYIQTPARIS